MHGLPSRGHAKARACSWPLSLLAAVAIAALGLAGCGNSGAHGAGDRGQTTVPPSTSPPGSAIPGSATSGSPAIPPGAAVPVDIVNFKFSPQQETIKAGTAVDWTNRDGVAHDIYFAAGNVHSRVLNKNDGFSRSFDTPGTYSYICAIHPFMHGTVVVTG
jgi:amicyanin